MRIINDGIAMVIEAAKQLYPEAQAKIYYDPELNGSGNLGETIFPDDKSTAIINLATNMSIEETMDILAHEIAHVVAGPENEHNGYWQSIYDLIYEKYIEVMEKAEKEDKNN